MNGYLYSNKTLLGEIDFSHLIEKGVKETGMGGIWGYFSPNENYQLVRAEIQNWNDSIIKDYPKRRLLSFNVQLENGYFVLPQGGYDIEDFADYPNESLIVRTVGIHSHIYSDYFIQKKPFLIQPWRKISIEEKFGFEDKYKNKTSFEKKLSFFEDYRWEPIFSALGFNEETKEVLFATSHVLIKTSNQKLFASFGVVDFVNKDEKGNPTFEFYESFDEFNDAKMN